MKETRKDVRLLYDGEAVLYLNNSLKIQAQLCNISSGGMLVSISANELKTLGLADVFAIQDSFIAVAFSLPGREDDTITVDIKLVHAHMDKINGDAKLGIAFDGDSQAGLASLREYMDIFLKAYGENMD